MHLGNVEFAHSIWILVYEVQAQYYTASAASDNQGPFKASQQTVKRLRSFGSPSRPYLFFVEFGRRFVTQPC